MDGAPLLRRDLHAAWRYLQEMGKQGTVFPQEPLVPFPSPFRSQWCAAGRDGGKELFVEADLPLRDRYVRRQVFSRDSRGMIELRVGEERLMPLFDAPPQGGRLISRRWETGSARRGPPYPLAPTGIMRSVRAVYDDGVQTSFSYDLLFLGVAILNTLAPAVMKMKGPKEPLRRIVGRIFWSGLVEAVYKVMDTLAIAMRGPGEPLKEFAQDTFRRLTGEEPVVSAVPGMTAKEGRLSRYIVTPPKVPGWHFSREGQAIEIQSHKGAVIEMPGCAPLLIRDAMLISYRPPGGTKGLDHKALRRLWGDALTERVTFSRRPHNRMA